jgi:O-antigen/teichoic acid export membrane protein
LLLKIVGALLTFGLYVLIGRLLGAEQAGMYFLGLAVATVAAVLGRVGLDGTMLRLIAGAAAVDDWKAVQGVFVKGLTIAAAGCSVAALATTALAPALAEHLFSAQELTGVFRWMALSIAPAGLIVLLGRALLGLKRVGDATVVNDVAIPGLSLAAVGLLAPRWGILGAVWAYCFATGVTLLVGLWRWRQATPRLRGVKGKVETREVLQSSIPLYWVACFQLVVTWMSTLALGVWTSGADVGVFGVANRTAALTSFILLAVNSIAAPKFAALHRAGDAVTLGRVARNCAKLTALAATPVLAICLVLPAQVMSVFGAEFASGAVLLSILAAGQFVNVVTGSVGFLLVMCGYEVLYRNNFLLCALVSIGLNLMLIPRLGIIGAAIATASTLALQNLIAAFMVWRKLGIMTIPLLAPRSPVP